MTLNQDQSLAVLYDLAMAMAGETRPYPLATAILQRLIHHTGSACGAGLSGKPSSTLGFEKRWNPGLAMNKAGFVEFLTKEIPPRPAEMDRMVAFNLGA